MRAASQGLSKLGISPTKSYVLALPERQITPKPEGPKARADFIHKMRIVGKELNETAVWLRSISKSSLLPPEFIADILAENKELARIVSASIKTARTPLISRSDAN